MNRLSTFTLRGLVLAVSLGGACLTLGQSAVPTLMTYQAFVTDASNVPLANANPANFVTTFRIYSGATNNTVIWAEQQTVTIFQGNFSVLLGNGQPVGGEPRPALDVVFAGAERYMGITVGANPEFTPRQRILPNAYAYRAKVAENVGSVISLNGNTANLVGGFTAGAASTINGNLNVNDINVNGGTLDVNTGTNTVLVGGSLDVRNSGGGGPVRIKFGRTGDFGNAAGVAFGAFDGVLIENSFSESGGFFVNGDTAAIWNPGDGDLLSIYDEDALGSGLAAAKRFSINGIGGFVANSSSSVTGNLSVSSTLDVDGFSNLDGFTSDGNGRVNGQFDIRPTAGDLVLDIYDRQGTRLLDMWRKNFIGREMYLHGAMQIDEELDVNGSLDVDGFTELDGFNSSGGFFVNGDSSLRASGGRAFQFQNSAGGGVVDIWGTSGVGGGTGDYKLVVYGNAAKNSGGSSWSTFSDRRLKRDIRPYKAGLDEVLQLNPVRFRYKDNPELGLTSAQENIGFIAQDVQAVLPDAALGKSSAETPLVLNADPIHWAAINAIKELHGLLAHEQTETVELKAANTALENRVAQLEANMEALTRKLEAGQ